MNNSIEKIYDKTKDIWGDPQTYRGINFHPLKIRESEYQKNFNFLFTYPKNSIPDRDILRMSYLKFVVFVMQGLINSSGFEVSNMLLDFLKHITKEKNVSISGMIMPLQKLGYLPLEKIVRVTNGIELKDISLKLIIGNVEFNETGFDEIREIILEQNGLSIEYVNEYNPELEKILVTYSKMNGEITFEDEAYTFASLLGKSMKEIGNYTIVQYKNHMKRMVMLKDYDLYKPLEAVGQIKVKSGEIKHYLSHFGKEGRYSSILVNTKEFEKNDLMQGAKSI